MSKRWVVLVLLLAARGIASAQISISIPGLGAVRAGETARIEWTGLPTESEELELLLSIEGRQGPVRVTPRLAARVGVLLWRVPNLPSARARLTLRYGLDGEEIESAPSAEFRILPSDVEPATALVYREGEWWARERSESPLRGLLGAGPAGERVQEDRQSMPFSAASSPPLCRRRTHAPFATIDSERTRSDPARPFSPRTPLDVPARI